MRLSRLLKILPSAGILAALASPAIAAPRSSNSPFKLIPFAVTSLPVSTTAGVLPGACRVQLSSSGEVSFKPLNPSTRPSPHPRFSLGVDRRSTSITGPLIGAALVSLAFDSSLHRWTTGHLRGESLDDISSVGNNLGGLPGTVTLAALALTQHGSHHTVAWEAASAAFDAEIVTTGLKYAVGRRRPDGGDGLNLSPFSGQDSFPSGHATFAFSLARVYGEHYPRFRPLAYGLASLVAFSRVQSNHHFLSDVLAGAAVGINGGQRSLDGKVSLLALRF